MYQVWNTVPGTSTPSNGGGKMGARYYPDRIIKEHGQSTRPVPGRTGAEGWPRPPCGRGTGLRGCPRCPRRLMNGATRVVSCPLWSGERGYGIGTWHPVLPGTGQVVPGTVTALIRTMSPTKALFFRRGFPNDPWLPFICAWCLLFQSWFACLYIHSWATNKCFDCAQFLSTSITLKFWPTWHQFPILYLKVSVNLVQKPRVKSKVLLH